MSREEGAVHVGMLGWSSQDITRNDSGLCWFPTGAQDSRYSYGYRWEKHRITAIEDIRAFKEIIAVDEILNCKEHTPIEAKILGYIYDDYQVQAYTGSEVKYIIGTAANVADSGLPSEFIAEVVWLLATTDCLVRFEANTRVQTLLVANVQYYYPRQCKELFIVQSAAAGSLTIRAFGNEVGV